MEAQSQAKEDDVQSRLSFLDALATQAKRHHSQIRPPIPRSQASTGCRPGPAIQGMRFGDPAMTTGIEVPIKKDRRGAMTKFEQALILVGSFAGASVAILDVVGGNLDWFTPRQTVRVMALGGILAGGLCLASGWMSLLRMRSMAEDEGRPVPATRYLGVGLGSLGYAVVIFLVVNDFF